MPKKTLYHYCSMDSFKSIVEGKNLRMSSLTLSNDSSEGKVIRSLFMELAKKDKLSKPVEREIENGLIQLENNFEGIGFCLSENGDLLDQWRVYASSGEGVAIGFSTEMLESLTSTPLLADLRLQLKPIIYKKNFQLEAIIPLYQYIRDRALEWEKNTTPSQAEAILPSLAERRRKLKPDNFYGFGSFEFVINHELFFLKDKCQGSRSYPPDITHPKIAFTTSHLPNPCPPPSVLCSFLPFWANDGNGQADGHGRGFRGA